MKKTLLILNAMILFFGGCTKDKEYEANTRVTIVDGEVKELEEFDEFDENYHTGLINGYKYVDLGLPSGLKWATCNVGAVAPESYGDYFAWGETETKSEYNSDNCSTLGVQMNDISGDYRYDAATANWGGTWRMPRKTELQELLNNCTWIWTTQNGVKGYEVTGPNGGSIFLPAAGGRYGSSLFRAGEYGRYWSSTPDESDSDSAYCLFFSSGNQGVYWSGRYYGRSVRPVTE